MPDACGIEHELRRTSRNHAAARVDVGRVEVGRVLVVDDSAAFRKAAEAVLSATTRLRPSGSADSGEEALRLLPDLQPDLVLLDVHMPGMNGVETARIIHRESPDTLVVLVSADPVGLEEAGRSAHAVAVLDKSDLFPQTLDDLWLMHGPYRRD